MKLRRLLSAPSLGVLYLIGFVYFVTVFVFIEDWVGLHSSVGSWNALGFTLVASLCVFTFLVCVLSEPGHVPSSYVPDVEHRGFSDQVSWKHDSQWNRCDKCHTFKPPRAHHCRVCRKCVLRMDHHCLWINNCVGYWNYKPFFVLLLYMTIASVHSTVIIVSSALQQDWKIPGIHSRKILYIACGAVTSGLTLVLGTLLCWHIYLILRNMTTIEYYEGKRAMWLARKSGQSYRHPFDVGPYRNISLVLGPNMLKWFCPTAGSHLKDGLSFPTLRDNS